LPIVSTQSDPHCCRGAQLALHAPSAQSSAAAQALPHCPQFAGSLVVSTHASPHWLVPPPQMHWPLEQSCPMPHAWPQAPQFCGSRSVLVHVAPQSVDPCVAPEPHGWLPPVLVLPPV